MDINTPSATGKTPLHYASGAGHVEVIQLLLKRGADVHARDRYQSTAVHYATWLGALSMDGSFNVPSMGTEIIGLLADAGADLDARDQKGSTALHLVVNLSTWDCRDAPDGETMFFEEETEMAATIARALLSKGASINMKDADGRTPLHLAASAGNLKLVQLLVQQGAKIDVMNHLHRTASMLAKENGHSEVVNYLGLKTTSKASASVSARDDEQSTLSKHVNVDVYDLFGDNIDEQEAARFKQTILDTLKARGFLTVSTSPAAYEVKPEKLTTGWQTTCALSMILADGTQLERTSIDTDNCTKKVARLLVGNLFKKLAWLHPATDLVKASSLDVPPLQGEGCISLLSFFFDRHPVEERHYNACVRTGLCHPRKAPQLSLPNLMDPAVGMRWEDALVYCKTRGMNVQTPYTDDAIKQTLGRSAWAERYRHPLDLDEKEYVTHGFRCTVISDEHVHSR